MFKNHSAASIIYAIVITTVIIVTAGTMSASFIRASQRNHDLFRSTQAYYAARAAMEAGIAANAVSGEVGFEGENLSAIGWNAVDASGIYQVFARSKWLGWQSGDPAPTTNSCNISNTADCYVVPMPGTGTAGASCDFMTPNAPDQNWDTSLDDPCNWNRIEYEQTATIPLYYEDSSCTDGICNPARNNLSGLILRVKTPNGELLDGSNEVVLSWEISGDCDTNGDGTGDEECYIVAGSDFIYNSQIKVSGVNVGNPYAVLTVASGEASGVTDRLPALQNTIEIIDFLQSQYQSVGDFEILHPTLKLIVSYPLTTGNGSQRIPYLEYQLLTGQPIGDSKVVYTASGSAVGRQGTYVRNVTARQGLDSDAIINFVVQN